MSRTVDHAHLHPCPIFTSAIARADRAELEIRLATARRHRREIAATQGAGTHGPESHDHAEARLQIRVILAALAKYQRKEHQ